MRSSFLLGAAPWCAALGLSVLVSLAACGQQGIVAGTSSTTETGGGGTGGATSTGGAGGDTSTGGAPVGQPFKIANWNIHNFFDTKKDTSSMYEMVLTSGEYSTKLGQVGAVIKAMDPDIIVMPECENIGIVNDLNTKQLGGAYNADITETNDFRGLDIGILSKAPIDKVVTHTTDMFKRLDLAGSKSYTYSRDAVEIHLTVNGRSVILLAVHYRSKGDGSAETDDKDKRAAEAQHTRAIADALEKADPKAAIVILGDFNDLPGSAPVAWTLAGDPKNNPKVTYTDAADSVAQGDRYSFVYNNAKELIDHQIANPLLLKMLDASKVVIRHSKDVEAASDHHPMMATYDIY
ncbi:MAG: endonuclease/exonuclease/phosphatase family protein [Polyangiaceae bacterium]